MIKVGNVSELNEYLYDENWLIVRKPDEIPAFVKHEPLLSPSPELFHKYREAYHAGLFNQEFFDQVYVPQFLKELSENAEAMTVLNCLVKDSKSKNILLACYCENESMCHRSIIAGVLLGMGAKIDTIDEYRKYYRKLIYRNIPLNTKRIPDKKHDNLDYFFDYKKELRIYKAVGSAHENIIKKIIRLKKDGIYFDKYTEWQSYLLNKYDYSDKNNNNDNNKQNFYRYLRRRYRDKKLFVSVVNSLVIPVEILFITGVFSFSSFSSVLTVLPCGDVGFILIILGILIGITIGLRRTQEEIDFLVDINEILINDDNLHLD